MRKFYVIITDDKFGVFDENKYKYTSFFRDNISQAEVVDECDLYEYLVKILGRNILVKYGFDMVYSIGRVFSL